MLTLLKNGIQVNLMIKNNEVTEIKFIYLLVKKDLTFFIFNRVKIVKNIYTIQSLLNLQDKSQMARLQLQEIKEINKIAC